MIGQDNLNLIRRKMGLSLRWTCISSLVCVFVLLFFIIQQEMDRTIQETDSYISKMSLLEQNQGYCPSLAPKFHFENALDDPMFHNGRKCDIAVFTVVFGRVDSLHDYSAGMVAEFRGQEKKQGVHSCWFAFLDEDSIVSSLDQQVGPECYFPNVCGPEVVNKNLWHVIIMPRNILPFPFRSTKNSRVPKMLGFRAFGHASSMLYFDGKKFWNPLTNFWKFIHDSKKDEIKQHDHNVVWTSPRHPSRGNVYEEARCVRLLELGGDDVLNQMNEYFEKGLPLEGNVPPLGLIEGEWSLRSLNSDVAARLGCEWFREYSRWNHTRDQLSFNYAAWSLSQSHWIRDQNVIKAQQPLVKLGLVSSSISPFLKYAKFKPPLGDIKRTSPFYVHRLPISVCRSGYDHGYPAAQGLEKLLALPSNPNSPILAPAAPLEPFSSNKRDDLKVLVAPFIVIGLVLFTIYSRQSDIRNLKKRCTQ